MSVQLTSSRARWAVGVVLPLVLIVLDPAVFRATELGGGVAVLARMRPFAYVATGVSVAAMVAALVLPTCPVVLNGVLGSGALFALVVGMAILPLSIIGTFAALGLGLLGLAPFVIAFVYGTVFLEHYQQRRHSSRRLTGTVVGAVFALAVPFLSQRIVIAAGTHAIDDAKSSDPTRRHSAVVRLKLLSPFLGYDFLVDAYSHESDSLRQSSLKSAYREVTGEDMQARLDIQNWAD